MKVKIFYLVLLGFVAGAIVYAGDGGFLGGGGGCGKGCEEGGSGNNDNTWWVKYLPGPYYDTNLMPPYLDGNCFNNYIDPSGLNTFPVITPQTIGTQEYFSQALVQDLVTAEIRAQYYNLGVSSGPIEVPKAHSFRVIISVYARCSDCMVNLITLPPGEGRRLIFNSTHEYPAGTDNLNPSTFLGYYGLASCL